MSSRPATRSQRAALASPLGANTRKRSASRDLSPPPQPAAAAPPPAAAAAAAAAGTTTTTTEGLPPSSFALAPGLPKRQYCGSVAESDEEEEVAQRPKKRSKLKDSLFQENAAKFAAARKAAEEVARPGPGTYPSPSQQPPTPRPRGFFGRLMATISPFRRPTTSLASDARLTDARIDLIQLQRHAELQNQLNHEISNAIKNGNNPAEEQGETGSKRKRSVSDITGLPALTSIQESPDISAAHNKTPVQATPARPATTTRPGSATPTASRARRTIREARAARAQRQAEEAAARARRQAEAAAAAERAGAMSMKDAPPHMRPAWARNARPPPPRNKNADKRLERLREIELLRRQKEDLEAQIAKLQAEEDAEAALEPRKTKRVKLDHLKVIPHNRLGESDGCFRVPEGDSDDEMEVDESAELVDDLDEGTTTSPVHLAAAAPLAVAAPLAAATPLAAAGPVSAAVPTSPEPAATSAGGSEIDFEDWPELPPTQTSEPFARRDSAVDIFTKTFDHWQESGEVLMDM